MKRLAFTLIELLVVIAIIGLLAAILFPVFARVRENARRSSCHSNMKQIMLGITQYTQDYDETYPPLAIQLSGLGNVNCFQLMQPYLKSTQVFHCPSDSSYVNAAVGDTTPFYGPRFPSSYVVNAAFSSTGSPLSGTVFVAGIPVAKVLSPSSTVYLADGASDLATAGTINLPNTEWPQLKGGWLLQPWEGGFTTSRGGPLPRHLETTNVGFADGHVKAMQVDKWYYLHPTGQPVSPWLNPTVGG